MITVLIKCSEIRVVVLSYRILHVRKMAFSSLRSFRDLLLSGDETTTLKCFNELDTCSIIQSDAVDLTQLPRDDLGTTLIPDDIAAKPSGNPVVLKSTGNGNCLYNSASLLLCGDESRSEGLRILVAGELYFNAEHYADHEIQLENFPKCRSRHYLQLPCQRMVIRYWPVVPVGSMLLKQRRWLAAKRGCGDL